MAAPEDDPYNEHHRDSMVFSSFRVPQGGTKKACKEQMAIDAMALMRSKGPGAVPDELQNVINRAVALANS